MQRLRTKGSIHQSNFGVRDLHALTFTLTFSAYPWLVSTDDKLLKPIKTQGFFNNSPFESEKKTKIS